MGIDFNTITRMGSNREITMNGNVTQMSPHTPSHTGTIGH